MERILSIDIGTTSAKMALVARNGGIEAAASASYPLRSEGPLMEQDAEEWWKAAISCAQTLSVALRDSKPSAIVVGGQMQDLIPMDGDRALGPAILYGDSRARDEIARLVSDLGEENLIRRTANLPDAAGLPAKLMKFAGKGERSAAGTSRFLLGAHDYAFRMMTGADETDHVNASTTGLLNFEANEWDREILAYLGLGSDRLPELAAAGSRSRPLRPDAAQRLGLPDGLPVFHGAGDAGANTVGCGAGASGVRSCYLGTSGWIASGGDAAIADPRNGIFNLRHPDPSKTIRIGPLLSAASNLEWIVRVLAGIPSGPLDESIWRKALEDAEQAKPGSSGIYFLPHLAGERSPFRDPDARGVFAGLTAGAVRGDFVRAVMEGVAFSLAAISREIAGTGPAEASSVVLTGGGAKSPLWGRILASVLDAAVAVPAAAENSGILGNAIVAGVGLGWYTDYSLPDGFFKKEAEYRSDPRLRDLYAELQAIHASLYPALKDSFARMARTSRTTGESRLEEQK